MSIPNWWGDWRQGLTPHTGNLQSTDLIECTMIVAGQPVNTVITGAQILGAVPTPSVAWGSITGTLSSQTDLNTALSGKASTGAVTGTGITMSTARILGRSTAGTGAIEEISIGTGLTLSAGTLSASGGGGGLTVGTTAIASGTIGRILFQGTGNVLQQSANLFWDNTSSRLGINTALPNMALDIRTGNVGIGVTSDAGFKLDVNGTARVQGDITIGSGNGFLRGTVNVVSLFSATDQVTVFSSNRGALSGTLGYFGVTELKPSGGIAQSSIGIGQTNAFVAISQGNVSNTNSESFVVNRGFFGNVVATTKNILNVSSTLNSNLTNATLLRGIYVDINNTTTFTGFTDFRAIESIRGGAYFNTSSVNASAILQADSTTKGFLPPRMTTAQKTAIASPAAGLVVYDTTLNKLCVRTASAWETITSL